MLERIKKCWDDFWGIIVIAGLALAYFIGKKRGKDDEKALENKKVLENVSRANNARNRLLDSDFARRLRDKYTRK